jgi:hypothetical protein
MSKVTADALGFASDGQEPSAPSNTGELVEDISVLTNDSYHADQVKELCKSDLDMLAALCMPTVFRYLFCDTFVQVWAWLLDNVNKVREFPQLALGLPRGFGKTMLMKLFIIYCILFTKKKFILVICGTITKAENVIRDVCTMLAEPNVKKLFGDFTVGQTIDRQDLKKFGFRGREIILMGAGAESDIRGITIDNDRPDVMLFDDIQTREDADSDLVSDKLEDWMYGTAMKAKSPEDCMFIFVGNMYPTKNSILRKLKHNSTWTSFIAGGILFNEQTGEYYSLWEELQPIRQLLKEYQNDLEAGKAEIFRAEVLNDEHASVNKLIDVTQLPNSPYGNETHQGNFIIVDPSNDKANSDAVSIGYFEIFDEKPVCKEIIQERLSPGESNRKAINMGLRHNCRVVGWESNAYQYSGLYWFNHTCNELGIEGFQIVPVYSGHRSKNSRILDMFKSLKAQEILLDVSVKPIVNDQIQSFNPLKTKNVDGILDCLTYAPKMIEEYGGLITAQLEMNLQDADLVTVIPVEETSAF